MCICQCFDVSKSELDEAIRDGHDSIEKLSEHLQVGSHCGGCIDRIEGILEKKKNRRFLWASKSMSISAGKTRIYTGDFIPITMQSSSTAD